MGASTRVAELRPTAPCGCPCECCRREGWGFDHCHYCRRVAEEVGCLGEHIRAFVARCERIDARSRLVDEAFNIILSSCSIMDGYRQRYGSVALDLPGFTKARDQRDAAIDRMTKLATESAAYDIHHIGGGS